MVDTRFFASPEPRPLAALLPGDAEFVLPDAAAEFIISDASEPEEAHSASIVLAANKTYAQKLAHSNAGAVIVGEGFAEAVPDKMVAVVAPKPHELFAAVLAALYGPIEQDLARRALVEGEHRLEEGVELGEGAVVCQGAEIGRGTIVGAHSVIGPGVAVGRDCVIGDNVSISCAYLGDRVIVHSGVRIGQAGFGWLAHGTKNIAVPQLGRVIVQDRVEIGANTTIDRGALSDTVIGENTKIDNLVQIGHNCRIGRNCLIAAMSGLSGGTVFGDGVLAGGGVGTSGHLKVGDGSVIHGRAAVTKDWPEGSKLAGAPAQDIGGFWRELAALRRLGRGGKA